MSEAQPADGGEAPGPTGVGLPQDLNTAALPGAREFILAVLVLSNGVRRVADLDQRELADAVNTSPQDVRNAFRDLRAEGGSRSPRTTGRRCTWAQPRGGGWRWPSPTPSGRWRSTPPGPRRTSRLR